LGRSTAGVRGSALGPSLLATTVSGAGKRDFRGGEKGAKNITLAYRIKVSETKRLVQNPANRGLSQPLQEISATAGMRGRTRTSNQTRYAAGRFSTLLSNMVSLLLPCSLE
jgi:hypothetical protein